MEHRKSKILFWVELIGSFIVIGSVLFGAGKMSQVVVDNRTSQEKMTVEFIEMKSNQRIMMATDSTNLITARELLDEVKTLKLRTSRIEWNLKLPPIEIERLPSTLKRDDGKMKPFSETLTIKEK